MYGKLENNNQNNEQETDYSKKWLETISDYASFEGVELDLNRILETMKQPTLNTMGRINGFALIAASQQQQLTIKQKFLDWLTTKTKSAPVATRIAALEILTYIIPLLTVDLAKAPLLQALTIALVLDDWTAGPTAFELFQVVIPKINKELISFLFDEINQSTGEFFKEKEAALLILMAPRLNTEQISTLIERILNQEDIYTNDQALILTEALVPYFSPEQCSNVLKIAMTILTTGEDCYINKAHKILSALLPKLTLPQITEILNTLVVKSNDENKEITPITLKIVAILIPYLTSDQLNQVMQDLIARINDGELEGYEVLQALRKRLSFLCPTQIRSISESIIPKLQDFDNSKRAQALKTLIPLVHHLSEKQKMLISIHFMHMVESLFKLRTLIAQPLDESQIGSSMELTFITLAETQQSTHTDIIEFITTIFSQLHGSQVDNLLGKLALQLESENFTSVSNALHVLTAITPQLTAIQITQFLNQIGNILKSEQWYLRRDALEFLLISAEQVASEVTTLFWNQIRQSMDDEYSSIREVALKIMKVILPDLNAEEKMILSKNISNKINNDEDSSVRRLATDLIGYFILSEKRDILRQFSNNILIQIFADLHSQLNACQATPKNTQNSVGIKFFDANGKVLPECEMKGSVKIDNNASF